MNALTISFVMLVAGADPVLPPALNRVILLDDFQIVEGRVQQVGDIVRIEPRTGPARVVNRKQILLETDSRGDVHDFMVSKMNVNNKDDLIRLAAWCEKVELWNEALLHARSAAEKAPEDAKFLEYVQSLEKKARAAAEANARTVPVATTAAMTPAKAAKDAPLAPPPESRIVYGQKIEPILMNRCAVCHARSNYTGAFKLMRVDPGYPNTAATVNNFTVVVNQLTPGDAKQSPLLLKSILVHGGQKTPGFFDRTHVAYQALEAWVVSVLPATPVTFGAKVAAAPVVSRPAPIPTPTPVAMRGFAVDAVSTSPPAVTPMAAVTPTAASPTTPAAVPNSPSAAVAPATVVSNVVPTTPVAPAIVPASATSVVAQTAPKAVVTRNPNDPFDPAIFNNLPK